MINLNDVKLEIDNILSKDGTKEEIITGLSDLKSKVEESSNRLMHPFELFGIECGYGWYGLVLPLYVAIQRYNRDKPEEERINIDQIKEKWGGLRFYISRAPEEFYDWVDRIEEESYKICEICGTTTDVTTEGKGWISTLCKQCRNQKNKH